jgi:hypothetical protein
MTIEIEKFQHKIKLNFIVGISTFILFLDQGLFVPISKVLV